MRLQGSRASWLAITLFLSVPAPTRAQDDLTRQCATIPVTADPTRRFCNLVAEAIELGQPRFALTLAGGNPLPGASSTLGMRLGTVPRISAGFRLTALLLELPEIASRASNDEINAVVPSFNIDAAIGILSGWSLLPTVGGFGSLDLVASVGRASLPGGDGFTGGSNSWAIGARLGLLRESFTAPGVSITGTYRKLGDVKYGDPELVDQESYFEMSGMRVLGLRGVIGKRLLFLGAMAGVGYDRFNSDVTFGVTNPGIVPPARFDRTHDGFSNSRVNAFGSAQWTMLILSIIGEIGWQSGGDAFTATLPSGRTSTTEKSTWFGSLAIRLAI